ncbi:transposase family protein [Sutcliffiella rhizosphaerae]|uniref:transposase family protein n=1 Tax=Sutcliffiella rhizosphaerae TaxID=2880967 RepID=UPI001E4C641C|nr:transposase family protein [Sutcliffiella rhizosphaerae]
MILPLSAIFTISFPKEDEPNVFPVKVDLQTILCPICQGKTIRHNQSRRRFRHGYAWNIGVLWIELAVPRQRCKACGFTFTYDYGLGLIRSSTVAFRQQIVKRCQGVLSWMFRVSTNFLIRP